MRISRVLFIFFMIFFCVFFVNSSQTKISEEVLREIEDGNNVKVIVELKEPSIEKGIIFTAQKTDKEITLEKKEIKDGIINKIDEDKIKHIFDESVALKISKEELVLLEKDSNIESIKIDKPIFAFLESSVSQVNASEVWGVEIDNVNLTGIGETICIIDTGIDFSHPDLIGKNKTCVIDCYEKSCVENCSVGDDHGHGTHVAGIAAASGNISGVARGANLIGVKALNSEGSGSSSDSNAGIDWCVDNRELYNISVISMSLGDCSTHSTYCNSDSSASHINNAVANNISVIVSAGNGNSGSCSGLNVTVGPSSPACVENATAVGGVYANDLIISSFQRGPLFELMAPGSGINSTYNNGGYSLQSGTSMSAPHVSGAFAIIRQFFLFQNNRIPTTNEIKFLLNNTGKLIDDSSGSGYNFTRIDVYSALVFIDSSNPLVNLISPLDDSFNVSGNITFRCSANDLELSNITFYLWNSTGIYNTSFREVGGVNAEAEFNLTNLVYDNYEWNCLAKDHNNNFSFASLNYSLTIKTINTILNSPENNTFTNKEEQIFNCSSQVDSSKELSNVTFYLWNSTDLIYNLTGNITGISNETIFSYNLTNETIYEWNCKSVNNESNFDFAKSNNTLIYESLSPNITLTEPFPEGEISSSVTRNFYYNITDNYNVENCSLIINNEVSLTNSSINLSSRNDFTQSFSPGNYVWQINCTDTAGNIGNSTSKSFTITAPTISSGGGGGGGGSSSVKSYTVFPEESSKGYTKELKKNDKIKFTTSNEVTEQHTLTANSIGEDYVSITIQSNPVNFTLYVGEEKKLNLTSSLYYDLYVRLNSVKNKQVNLTIKTIYEEIFQIPEEMETEDDGVEGELEEEGVEETISETNYFRVIIIILIIVVIFFLRIKKVGKRSKKDEGTKTKRSRE